MMAEVDYSSIPAPSRKCVVCGRDLAAVPKHPSVLDLDERGKAERRDLCPECWEKMADKGFFSFWLTHREPPKPDMRKTRLRRRETLRRLFDQFRASGDERFKSHIYILAHILMKNRLLVWEGTEKPDGNAPATVVFRDPASDELIRVEEVEIEDETLVAVKREIDAALAAGAAPSDNGDEDSEEQESAKPKD